MRITDNAQKKWVRWTTRSKTRRTLSTAESTGWSVSKKSLRLQPTRKRTQTSSRCRKTSWRRSFGRLSWKRKWRRRWNAQKSSRRLSKRFEPPLDTQTFRILYRNSLLGNKHTPNYCTPSASKKKRSTVSGKTTRFGGRSSTTCKSSRLKSTLPPTGQRVHSHLSWTSLTIRSKTLTSSPIFQATCRKKYNSLTIRFLVGVLVSSRSLTSSSTRILVLTLINRWRSNSNKLCLQSTSNLTKS